MEFSPEWAPHTTAASQACVFLLLCGKRDRRTLSLQLGLPQTCTSSPHYQQPKLSWDEAGGQALLGQSMAGGRVWAIKPIQILCDMHFQEERSLIRFSKRVLTSPED